MDMREINELIETFSEHGLTCLELEEGDKRIAIKKELYSAPAPHAAAQEWTETRKEYGGRERAAKRMGGIFEGSREAKPLPAEDKTESTETAEMPEGNIVKSPLVGMFYSSSSPDSEPFVQVGDSVKKGQVIGIIEAMKLMNEVTSDFDGVLSAVLAENGQVVEYGQPLFEIR